jgi:hypothetical protein
VTDVELSASLVGTVDENLGCLSLTDYSDSQQEEILLVIRSSLLRTAELELPPDLPNRGDAIGHIQELIALVSAQ